MRPIGLELKSEEKSQVRFKTKGKNSRLKVSASLSECLLNNKADAYLRHLGLRFQSEEKRRSRFKTEWKSSRRKDSTSLLIVVFKGCLLNN